MLASRCDKIREHLVSCSVMMETGNLLVKVIVCLAVLVSNTAAQVDTASGESK